MSHRVKNLFALTAGMIRLTARSARTKEELAETLSGRLQALSDANALVRRQFGDNTLAAAHFGELVGRILRPYGHAKSSAEGPDVAVGERSVNNLALIFHELATNAAKYGALGAESGRVTVRWTIEADTIDLIWKETGGPKIAPPSAKGFGSQLVASTIKGIGGQADYDWLAEGLTVRLKLRTSSFKS